MAIVMTSTSPMSSAQYDEVIAGLAPHLATADGFIAHYAEPGGDDGWSVVEIWESAEQHAAWFAANVRPHLPEDVPAPEVRRLHNVVLAAGSQPA